MYVHSLPPLLTVLVVDVLTENTENTVLLSRLSMIIYLIFIAFLIDLVFITAYGPVNSFTCRYSKSLYHSNALLLHFIDPNDANSILDSAKVVEPSLTEFVHETYQVFVSSVSSRLIGTILGNLFAAFLLKQLTEFSWQKIKELFSPSSASSSISSSQVIHVENPSNTSTSMRQVDVDDITMSGWTTLLLCVLVDVVGDSSFVLPGIYIIVVIDILC